MVLEVCVWGGGGGGGFVRKVLSLRCLYGKKRQTVDFSILLKSVTSKLIYEIS